MAGLEGVKGVGWIGLVVAWMDGLEGGLVGGYGRRFHDIISWFQGEQYDGLVRDYEASGGRVVEGGQGWHLYGGIGWR